MRIVLHIGISKSGTTFLQESIFARCPELFCAGRPYHGTAIYKNFWYGICQAEDYEVEDYVAPFLEYLHQRNNHRNTAIISDEQFTVPEVKSFVIARLQKYFPQATLLLTIRNQLTAIKSYYANHGCFPKGIPGTNKPAYIEFDEFLDFYLAHPDKAFFRSLQYRRLLKSLLHYFPKENIKILIFEEMLKEPKLFFDQLSQVLEIKESDLFDLWKTSERKNKGLSGRSLLYRKIRSKIPAKSVMRFWPFSNKLSQRINNFIEDGKDFEVTYTEQQREKLANIYAQENVYLEENFDLSLSCWNYPTKINLWER